MGNYNRSGGGFKNRPSGRGSDRRGGDRPTMHRTTCTECGDSCEVPFKPTGSKPVLCSSCFGKQDGGGRDNRGGGRGGFGGERRERHRDRDRQMHDVVCGKCGKDCQVPFKPSSDKPVFCDDCFGKSKGKGTLIPTSRRDGSRGGGRDSGGLVEQVKMLNDKIDRLIGLLDPNASKKKTKPSQTRPDKLAGQASGAGKKAEPKKDKVNGKARQGELRSKRESLGGEGALGQKAKTKATPKKIVKKVVKKVAKKATPKKKKAPAKKKK